MTGPVDPKDWKVPGPYLNDDGKNTNVTHLENYRPRKQPGVWECECGGQRFWLQEDGMVICGSCSKERTSLIWGYRT